ncbi:MAG: tRNA-dihydrouridine synthase, partial [Ignavibacteriae bacterium]|nr:tRNA-dihydrouridine synthase [Ignavibacteriota bacterium]
AKMVEDCGAKGLTIHCRTRSQGNRGEVDYSHIPEVKQAVSIPIIVNGGIDTPQKAKSVFEETGCDGIMIASSAISNPWIFSEIKHFLNTNELLAPPSLEERINLLVEHLNQSIQLKGERGGVIEFRKYYSGYLRDFPGISKLRIELMQFVKQQDIINKLNEFLNTRLSFQPTEHDLELA